jgi:hypothetical protein
MAAAWLYTKGEYKTFLTWSAPSSEDMGLRWYKTKTKSFGSSSCNLLPDFSEKKKKASAQKYKTLNMII